MKQLGYLLFVPFITACMLMGCDKSKENKQIELDDETEKNQQVFADDETTGGITFTAQANWTANVTETTPLRASSVSWLRLLLEGKETYSGGAGVYTLTIELDTNYTGETRSASITIRSGNDEIAVNVTQHGKTEQGTLPDPPAPKLTKRIAMSLNDPHRTNLTVDFEYDNQKRLKKYTTNFYDELGSLRTKTYIYESSTKVTGTVEYSDAVKTDRYNYTMTLNADGWLVNSVEDDWDWEGETESVFEYANGYLSKVTSTNTDEDYVANFTWTDGNLTKITDDYRYKGSSVSSKSMFVGEYSDHINNLNLDVVNHMEYMSAEKGLNLTGKFSKNLVSKIEEYAWRAGSQQPDIPYSSISYTYEFSDGYVTKYTADISEFDENGNVEHSSKEIFTITYY